MTNPIPRKNSISPLKNNLLLKIDLRMEAVCRLDVPAANIQILAIARILNRLRSTAAGRSAVEDLLLHPAWRVKISAAEAASPWAARSAVPVLGQALIENLRDAIASPDERLDIRIRAGDSVYKYFEIEGRDRNLLIAPLRAYGIDLPWYDHSKWQ